MIDFDKHTEEVLHTNKTLYAPIFQKQLKNHMATKPSRKLKERFMKITNPTACMHTLQLNKRVLCLVECLLLSF